MKQTVKILITKIQSVIEFDDLSISQSDLHLKPAKFLSYSASLFCPCCWAFTYQTCAIETARVTVYCPNIRPNSDINH